MKYLFILILLNSCTTQKYWSYYGVNSPENWGRITSEYRACELGHNQSPIDLSRSQSIEMTEKIGFNYHDSKAILVDNGHTVQAIFSEKNYTEINEKRYYLEQIHFHTHSEHSVEGVFFPLELHMVHKSKDGKLAVLAFFIDINDQKPNRFGFFENIQKHKRSSTIIRLSKLLNYSGEHFYYNGSLTTPPCTEGVHWIVFDKHLNLNRSQVEKFRSIYTRNYRHINHHKFEGQLFHSSI